MTNPKDEHGLIWLGGVSYLLLGVTEVIIGSLLPELLKFYGKNYSNGGVLIFSQFIGFLLGVLISPWCVRRFGRRNVLLLAFLSLGVAQFSVSKLPHWYIFQLVIPISGLGLGIIQSTVGALILELIKHKQSKAMSKLEVFFGLGSLLMPFVVSMLIKKQIWSWSFTIVSIAALIMAILWKWYPFGEYNDYLKEKQLHAQKNKMKVTNSKRNCSLLIIFVLFFFLYVGIEVSISNYIPSIFIEKFKISNSFATLSVAVFWSAMVIGRALTGVISAKISYSLFLNRSNIGTFLILIFLAVIPDVQISFILVVLIGLFMSGIFAIALLLANQTLQGSTQQTSSLLIASAGSGGAVLPLFIGWCLDTFSYQATLWILAAFALLMNVFMVLVHKFSVSATKNEGLASLNAVKEN
ncbi:MFS transporter [Fodinisporobacter ferrooxydans]|uniref:MFS transporter n=1 Tax=Fodinisporobacter ferrooxydans TaxID=2901836 RepID=A0ABY4CPN9_9BACL|nr:MFS transporter [Alicyclobacillaceae bacterium MYW30-H2]